MYEADKSRLQAKFQDETQKYQIKLADISNEYDRKMQEEQLLRDEDLQFL